MYVYEKAITVGKDLGARWVENDISNLPISDIFNFYRKVYVTLSNVFLNDFVTIDLDILRNEFLSSNLTLNEVLVQIDNRTLETVNFTTDITTKYAIWSDAFRANYKITPQNIYASTTAEMPFTEKTSLKIERHKPETDMELFYKSCLVSINGFFHRTDFDGTAVYALDATKSLFKSKQNQIGFLSFNNIGEIEQVPITTEMIFPQSEGTPLKDKTVIKLNKNIENKTVIMVLGGYLLFCNNKSLIQINDDTFLLSFNTIPLLERYFESRPYLNLDSLGLPVSTDNESLINVEEYFSDTVLTKYLTLPQSYFVIIDTPTLFTNKIYLRSSKLPGMFTAYQEPKYPLIVNNGRVAEYWKTHEDGYWAVNVYDSYLKNNVFSTKPESQLDVISDSRVPLLTNYNSRGFLLEIGSDRF